MTMFKPRLIIGFCLILCTAQAHGQTFQVDFSRQVGVPLVKTKFGVYQTPLTSLPRLWDTTPLLQEAGIRDVRYEIGWGKPDVLAFWQIGGTATRPTTNFSILDAFVGRLQQAGVKPLLAMGYCPNPLKSRSEWAGWKDMPSDLAAWQKINFDYARHFQGTGCSYEIWNEPDMPEPNSKMFFSGTPSDYGQLYGRSVAGIRAGDMDAPIGGPAIAYDLGYLTPILSQPMDFASIHGYANWQTQIGGMQRALAQRPELPIYLTEYASFSSLPPNGPQSRSEGAARFFEDVKGLLACTDVTKVYWAQWLDAGDGPGMGLITWDGHRKALFNAFKIYGDMPVDRSAVVPDVAEGVDALASSDEHRAGVVVWNTSAIERTVTVQLNQLPFKHGTLMLSRIDHDHASYIDNPASENLETLQSTPFDGDSTSWSGVLPAHSVVYLKAVDGVRFKRFVEQPVGTFGRTYGWFPDRPSVPQEFADFDERTGTARVGLLDVSQGTAQIGTLIKHPALKWRVRVDYRGRTLEDRDGMLGILLNFQDDAGHIIRSVLYDGGGSGTAAALKSSWQEKRLTGNRIILEKAMINGRPFEINLRRLAPPEWSGQRVVVTFIMQNTGRGSRAQIVLAKG
ncbi:hypothetical protein IAD21_03460 [Abditibacteriota bacterium]|nr:hypothetical protein IAD21_03460 [Abditibacteriota bacterium]